MIRSFVLFGSLGTVGSFHGKTQSRKATGMDRRSVADGEQQMEKKHEAESVHDLDHGRQIMEERDDGEYNNYIIRRPTFVCHFLQ